ncbi:MAG: Glu-tRNA(Gln) amidotransferase subunit GatD [Candidatus Ranarchaeia archaeon]|jgi:glutamyl-tRNA(Gln) amidotransferase subunit D
MKPKPSKQNESSKDGYTGTALTILQKHAIKVGDRVSLSLGKEKIEGVVIPRAEIGADKNHIIIKLDNGYNIGVRVTSKTVIERIGKGTKVNPELPPLKIKHQPNLPTVGIISTGGTIASRVDYKTGAVVSALSANDLLTVVPELSSVANIKAEILDSIFSENMTPKIWSKMVKAIQKHIGEGVDGIVIAHGTDTLHYTAAAIAFACQNLPVPVCLVGSQRSSDRPSSDAAVNLLSAVHFASKAQYAGVSLLMHSNSSDELVTAHHPTKARKCHTSRRDAFLTINGSPIAEIDKNSEITFRSKNHLKRDKTRTPVFAPKFDSNVTILKTYPGMTGDILETHIAQGVHGIILEGTGLGHAPHSLYEGIRKAKEKKIPIVMTSQCIWGRTNMNVYRTGVELLDRGIVQGKDMVTETAYAKLSWVLGQTQDYLKVLELLRKNLSGEFSPTSRESDFIGRINP